MVMKPRGRVDDVGRQCTKCGVYKVWAEFNKDKYGFKGKRPSCRLCDSVSGASWRHENPDHYQSIREEQLKHKRDTYCPIRKKNYDLQKKYGIDLGDFNTLFDIQNGKCKLCNTFLEKFTNKSTRMQAAVVDHCHTTGVVRGLLCHTCNRAIGLMKDDSKLLRLAAEYVEKDGLL